MDWGQILTVTAPVIGAVYAFYTIVDKKIDVHRAEHREDIKNMDAKWERLFEHFITQGQQKKG